MFTKMKKLFKSTAFNILLIFLFAAIVLFFTLKDDGDKVAALLGQMNIWMVVFLVVLMIVERALLGLGLMWICRETHPKYSFLQGFINAYVAGLFCNITPGASGGQLAQAYVFKRQGIPFSRSFGVLWLEFIIYQSTMTILVFLLILLKYPYFRYQYSEFFIIVLFGFLVSSFVIVMLFLLAKSEKVYTWVTTKGISLAHRFHFIKDKEATLENLNSALSAFTDEIDLLSHRKKLIVKLVIENVMRLLIYYSIPYFAAKALNIQVGFNELLNIIALSSFVAMVNAFLPMPGSSGGTEATFVLMFSTIFSSVDAKSIMLLWRFVTFYQMLIIGTIMFMISKILPEIPARERLD
ncbi:MAG: flippase-like domain-containing protein [Solobacterium sp.]|nr:flippase-like domain-containing protein [Solobacterium sp.]